MKKLSRIVLAIILCTTILASIAGCGTASKPPATTQSSETSAADTTNTTNGAKEETDFPKKDITMIIPTGAGGGSDVIARYLADALGKELGVTVVPQNIGGAATAIAFEQFMNAVPDGYTIIMSLSSLATMKSNGYADITYQDVEQICCVNYDSNCIFIRPDESRFTTVEEFIAYAKAHPGELNCGTGSPGGVAHIAITDFCDKAGIKLNIVPDTSGGGFNLKLENGDVDCIVCGPIDIASAVEAGTVVPIVSMTKERLPDFPDCPTAIEIGVDATISMFRGYHAPKGTPQAVIDKLEAAFKTIVESDDYKEFLTNQYSNALFLDSEDWTAKCAEELSNMPPVYEKAGISVG